MIMDGQSVGAGGKKAIEVEVKNEQAILAEQQVRTAMLLCNVTV